MNEQERVDRLAQIKRMLGAREALGGRAWADNVKAIKAEIARLEAAAPE